jgi:PadR family transcriptional regulator, regulatory protein PadR
MSRSPSAQARRVLEALGDEPQAWRHGYDLLRQTGLKSGSLYPILIRLTERGWLEASWESDPPPGRPPRHLYRLTGEGRRARRELRERPQPVVPRRPAAGAT